MNDQAARGTIAHADVPMPEIGMGDSYIEPLFGSLVTQVSGSPGSTIHPTTSQGTVANRIQHANVPVWNAHDSLMTIKAYGTVSGPEWLLLDEQTYEVLDAIDPGIACRAAPPV